MALSYRKITEEEDQMRNVLIAGEYPFCVAAIERTRTKENTADMLVVDMLVMDADGREVKVRDWIVFMDQMAWKFRHFAATCGLLEKYENNTIEASDFINQNGVVKLTVGEYVDKDGEVVKNNRVKDYIKPGFAKVKTAQDLDPSFNDDIKF